MLQGSCESEEKDVISIWPMTQRAGPPQRAPAGTAVAWECVRVSVRPGSVGAAGCLQTLRVQCGWFLQPAASLGSHPALSYCLVLLERAVGEEEPQSWTTPGGEAGPSGLSEHFFGISRPTPSPVIQKPDFQEWNKSGR